MPVYISVSDRFSPRRKREKRSVLIWELSSLLHESWVLFLPVFDLKNAIFFVSVTSFVSLGNKLLKISIVGKNKMESSEKLLKDGRNLKIFDSLDELSIALADYVAELSEASVKERGFFTIALSDGSIINLLGKLCESPFSKTVDWGRWHIFWADERVVAKNHKDSNYIQAKDGFLSKVPIISSHVYSINDSIVAEEAAEEYEFVLRQLVKSRVVGVSETNDCPKFDLILLGMGDDGHVASLFPNHRVLEEKKEWVTFITNSPNPPPERITFTIPVINSASNVAIVVTGANKASSIHVVMDDLPSDGLQLPAQMICPTNGKLVWFLDTFSASQIEYLPSSL